MDFSKLLDTVLHLDVKLESFLGHYGPWSYLVLFIVIFCETGLVVTPFLPGDSLLFAAGLLAADNRAPFNVFLLAIVLVAAALSGDNVNYFLGCRFGVKLFKRESRFFNRKNLDRTHEFFEKYGGKTIIIARFVPVIRTFAPFVAGTGRMTYKKFVVDSLCAAILWVGVCLFAGYFFGRIPVVRDNFVIALLALIIVSAVPVIFESVRHFRKHRSNQRIKREEAAKV